MYIVFTLPTTQKTVIVRESDLRQHVVSSLIQDDGAIRVPHYKPCDIDMTVRNKVTVLALHAMNNPSNEAIEKYNLRVS